MPPGRNFLLKSLKLSLIGKGGHSSNSQNPGIAFPYSMLSKNRFERSSEQLIGFKTGLRAVCQLLFQFASKVKHSYFRSPESKWQHKNFEMFRMQSSSHLDSLASSLLLSPSQADVTFVTNSSVAHLAHRAILLLRAV